MKPLSCKCLVHNTHFVTSWNNFQIQLKKGRGGFSLCPDCVKDARPSLAGCKNPAFVGSKGFQERLNAKFGIGVLTLVSKYVRRTSPVKVKHTCGLITTARADSILGQVYPCSCARIAALVPFSVLTEVERSFMAFCFKELNFSVAQISELTGVAPSTVRTSLERSGVMTTLNTTNGKRRTLERLKGSDINNHRAYNCIANRITSYMAKAYSEVLDPKGVRSRDFHLDHQLSKYDGYSRYSKPVPLTILCHPANLKLLPGADNIRKNKASSISLPQLRKRILKFERRHGVVVFPDHYQVHFERTRLARASAGLRVLGLDPGTANFGVFGGIIHGVKTVHGVEPVLSKMFVNTVRSLTNQVNEATQAFLSEFEEVLAIVQPDVVVIERFQTRGLMGPTVELVSFMLGLVGAACQRYAEQIGKHIIVRPVVAGQWKNALNRKANLEDMYEALGTSKLHHRLDAMLMSLYAFPNKDVYECLTSKRQAAFVNYIKGTK